MPFLTRHKSKKQLLCNKQPKNLHNKIVYICTIKHILCHFFAVTNLTGTVFIKIIITKIENKKEAQLKLISAFVHLKCQQRDIYERMRKKAKEGTQINKHNMFTRDKRRQNY